jgi:hypothetical protein
MSNEVCTDSSGVVFPAGPTKVGKKSNPHPSKRSTTSTAKMIYSAALEAANDEEGRQACAKLKASSDKKWRYGYRPFVRAVASSMASHDASPLEIARAGLQSAHKSFNFRRKGFQEMSLMKACEDGTFTGSFVTGVTKQKSSSQPNFTGVPYNGKEYRGDDLVQLANDFSKSGQAEPSFSTSIHEIINDSTILKDGLTDHVFVLMGATSEMGPLTTLLDLGASVIALARPASKRDPEKWIRLLKKAENSPGKMIYPTRSKDASIAGAGADALTDTPEIINWLVELFQTHPLVQNKTLYMYSGIYLDGGMFVRASMAMEMIISECTKRLPSNKLPALIYIDTPSHAHVVARETYDGHLEQKKNAPLLLKIGATCGLIKNPKVIENPGNKNGIVVMDFLATQQGPNYSLAKQLQRWRAIWARHSEALIFPGSNGKEVVKPKQLVSLTLGPAAKTDSVMHSPTMAMVMNTIEQVKPNVAHEPETVQALMTLIMIRDIKSSNALGNPANDQGDTKNGTNPHMNFLVENSWHGGYWRSPYAMDSVG